MQASRLKIISWAVHLYTALGVACAVMVFQSIVSSNYYHAAIWLLVSIFIDITDGSLARAANVTRHVPQVDGKRMDHLVDFLNVSFLPLMLMAHAGWLPEPRWLWVCIAGMASLLNYSMVKTEAHRQGFFQGFPALYSIFVFYGLLYKIESSSWLYAGILMAVAILELLPLRFVRPRDAPAFRSFFYFGGFVWFISLILMLSAYPAVPASVVHATLTYPVLYIALSIYISLRRPSVNDQQPNTRWTKKLVVFFVPLIISAVAFEPIKAWLNGNLNVHGDFGPESRASTAIAPDPQQERDAVVQIYAARLVGWRGAYAIHTWTAVKAKDEMHFTTYEMDDDPDLPPPISSYFLERSRQPDQRWFGSQPILLADFRGESAERAIVDIRNAARQYPYRDRYRPWPGPNSNTLTAYLIRSAPDIHLDLPPAAIGKDYPVWNKSVAETTGKTGYQISFGGLFGMLIGKEEGIELQFLGLTIGFDFDDLSLKLPGMVSVLRKGCHS